MKKMQNESYNRIIDYLKDNPSIDKTEKKLLLSYATELILNNRENVSKISSEEVYNDITSCCNYVSYSSTKTASLENVEELCRILTAYRSYLKNNNYDLLEEISERLDMFFLKNDLGIRKNSNLSYYLIEKKDKKLKKENSNVGKYYGK